MQSSSHWTRILGATLLAALLCTAGCASKPQSLLGQYNARVSRGEPDQVADAKAEAKADQDAKAKDLQRDQRLRRLEAALVARGDPDSLAAAALFERVLAQYSSPMSLDLASRAFVGAPTRPELGFVLLQLCESEPSCDPRELEARLRLLDPTNGITWTYALLRADLNDQAQERSAARAGLAQAQRVDMYWNRIISHLTAAAAGKAGFDTNAAMLEVIGIEAAFVTALQPVSRVCSVQEVQQPDILAQCRRIAAAFQHGDTTLLEGYGASLALRLYPAGSPQSLAIATERRGLHYRIDLMTRNATKVNSAHATRTLEKLMERYPTEQLAFRALYVDLGLNPDPPAAWVDRWPGG